MTTRASSSSSTSGGAGSGTVRAVAFGAAGARTHERTSARPPIAEVLAQAGPGDTSIEDGAKTRLTRALGHAPAEADVRGLVGAPAEADVSAIEQGDGSVLITLTGPRIPGTRERLYGDGYDGAAERKLQSTDIPGVYQVSNEQFHVHPDYQGQGIGLQVFARQVKALAAMRNTRGEPLVSRIHAYMAGSPRYGTNVGYKVWYKMGYNTERGALAHEYDSITRDPKVDPALAARVQTYGRDMTLRQLTSTREGREWWDKNGSSIDGYFNLHDPVSQRILRHYVDVQHARGKVPAWNDL